MATKKDIRLFCSLIREGKNQAAEDMLVSHPELVNSVAHSPPKKDDGLSPLQVACKAGNLDFAVRLIEHGADVNYIDTSEVAGYGCPVLHDVVGAASMFAGKEPQFHPGKFEEAFNVVQVMLKKGADPEAKDARGNNALFCAFLEYAKSVGRNRARVEHFKFSPLIPPFRDLVRTLLAAGANPDTVCTERRTTRTLAQADGLDFVLRTEP